MQRRECKRPPEAETEYVQPRPGSCSCPLTCHRAAAADRRRRRCSRGRIRTVLVCAEESPGDERVDFSSWCCPDLYVCCGSKVRQDPDAAQGSTAWRSSPSSPRTLHIRSPRNAPSRRKTCVRARRACPRPATQMRERARAPRTSRRHRSACSLQGALLVSSN